MSLFVDTSAIVVLIDIADPQRPAAIAFWEDRVRRGLPLVSTNYVAIETAAVLQRRLGLAALRLFVDQIAPLLEFVWVNPNQHARGVEAALLAGRRKLSVVDCVSFHVMREHRITAAFAFDDHFREQGFTVLPEPAG